MNLEIETEEPEIVFAEFEGRRYSCAAHNIQLCLNHATKSTLMSSAAFKKHLKLQMRFAHSASARSELKAKGKLYKTFFKVRWGTSIDVLKRFFEMLIAQKRLLSNG